MGTVLVTGTGFKPGSEVTIAVDGAEPIARVTVRADGTFVYTATLPAGATRDSTIVIRGVDDGGRSTTVRTKVSVKGESIVDAPTVDPDARLALTGSDAAALFGFASLLIVVGLVLTSRRQVATKPR